MGKYNEVKMALETIVVFLGMCIPIFAQPTCSFNDDFGQNFLDAAKWTVFSGTPFFGQGRLILTSSLSNPNRIKTDVQSNNSFLYGKLEIVAGTSNWKSGRLNDTTDTSIGFEIFYGKGCHNGILITNGTLGILRAFPVIGDSCSGDPIFQKYFPIPNWDSLRKTENKYTIIWAADSIGLIINDSIVVTHTHLPQDSLPNLPMKIRLNCNVDLDRNHGVTKDTLKVDRVCYYVDPMTGIKERDINKVPKGFLLYQNFPNPFDSETAINYQIPKPSRIVISIYDILGQKIRTLVQQRQQEGFYTVSWDGKDNSGRPATSGIYFYKVDSEQFFEIKKMIVLRH